MNHRARHIFVGSIFIALFLALAPAAFAGDPPTAMARRVPWTTSHITGSPDLPSPYRLTPAFPNLKFKNPLDAEPEPGGQRMYVLEQKGKVLTFPVNANTTAADEALDLSKFIPEFKEAYGLTFHPGFKTNRYFYVCYVLKDGLENGTHVSRFKVSHAEPPVIDPASETTVLTWLSGGHNGGCLKFGPDGCLYISTGDGAGPNPPDTRNTGQDISDLLSSILRIDVDHPAAGKPYRVPADNPFVNHPGARPEVWAYGLRNPWKMSFDPKTGGLWVGDVGWELWEMVYLIQRGGNYGWSIMEGNNPIKSDGVRGPTPILPPAIALPHSEAASITGGFFYYGKRLPELVGAYIYGDWATGKMWALRHEKGRVTSNRELLTSNLQIISYALDNAGELYAFDYAGTAWLLEPNPAPDTSKTFPRRLSETGLFASVSGQSPAPGVVSYSINAGPWADHATAHRWVAFPGTSQIQTNREKWLFPKDAVLAKTLSLEMERGQPGTARRMETQLLHFDGTNWQCYSYRWNDTQTDATLVSAAGEDRACEIRDPQAPGGKRQQTWHYHSRAECLRCHNPWAGSAVAYNFAALNKTHPYGSQSSEQLPTLGQMGLVPPVAKTERVPKLADPYDTTADLDARARAYLQVNCAHCHRQNAGGGVATILNHELKASAMNAIGATPTRGTFALTGAQVIAPGDPFHSVLYYRIATAGQGHMPHIGPRTVDERGVNLMHDWIRQLTGRLEKSADDEALELIARNPKTSPQALDQLLAGTSGALALARQIANHSVPASVTKTAIEKAMASKQLLVRDLFDQFLADGQRSLKLGTHVSASAILALKGDAARGKLLFFQEGGAQCQQCHRANGQGRDFGPDLTQIGRKYSRAQLLENILTPSKTVDPGFVSYQIDTKDELSYTGFIIRKSVQEVVLKDANLNEIHVPAGNIKSQEAQSLSAMPEGLLQNLTAQNAADLVEFLFSLK